MPTNKKIKQPEQWDVILDGKRVGTAPTEAKAKSIMREMAKSIPSCMTVDFKVERRDSAHCTTA